MARNPQRRPRFKPIGKAMLAAVTTHRTRREGDETACSCGKRWPVGEDHP